MIGNRPQVRADGRVPTQLRPVRFEEYVGQERVKARQVLLPPKANEFDSTASTETSRGEPGM